MSTIQAIQAVTRREQGFPEPKPGDLRVVHFPQVPCRPFIVPVASLAQAKLVCDVLADYDLFQFAARIKPDYCNATTVEAYGEDYSEDGKPGWCDWFDDSSWESGKEFAELNAHDIAEIDRRMGR